MSDEEFIRLDRRSTAAFDPVSVAVMAARDEVVGAVVVDVPVEMIGD
jgi:hypothetical protein